MRTLMMICDTHRCLDAWLLIELGVPLPQSTDCFTQGCSYLIEVKSSHIQYLTLQLKSKMSTIAKVFDIDQQTGFMASDPPLERLPQCWEAWEMVLDIAFESKLQVGDKLGLTDEERVTSKRWRDRVRAVRITLSIISF